MFKNLITHRGIDVSLDNCTASFNRESSWEAFSEQVQNGFGLEFDIRLTCDEKFVVSHENSLNRITNGRTLKLISEMSSYEIRNVIIHEKDRLCFLDEILLLISQHNSLSALHLKGDMQTESVLELLVEELRPFIDSLAHKLIVFDVRPDAGRILKKWLPQLNLAASVSDDFDVLRFSKCTKNTLMRVEDIIKHKDIYSWAWLDEWDLKAPENSFKKFVCPENVKKLKEYNFKIAAVSPELHATSPHLLGAESHELGSDIRLLINCWKEWGQLDLDALCTDYATSIKQMLIEGRL